MIHRSDAGESISGKKEHQAAVRSRQLFGPDCFLSESEHQRILIHPKELAMNTKNNQRYKDSEKRIQDALMKLMENQELEDVTVMDICKEAHIN